MKCARIPCRIFISKYKRKRKGRQHSVKEHYRTFSEKSHQAAMRSARRPRKRRRR